MTKLRKDAVLIANKIEYDESGVPVELVEAQTQADGGNLSARFGTVREPQTGKAYLFNASSRIDVIANDGDISSVSALDETGAIVALTAAYATNRYQITGVDGNKYWNIKCWANGVTPTDAQKKAYTLEDSGGEANLFTWFKCEEESGEIALKAYHDAVSGTIVNNYTGFHSTQSIYSFKEEEGYNGRRVSIGGDFSDPAEWVQSDWWTIANNEAVHTAGSLNLFDYIEQIDSFITITGNNYRIYVNITSYSGSGLVGFSVSGGVPITARRSSVGIISLDFVSSSGGVVRLFSDDDVNCVLSAYYITELGPSFISKDSSILLPPFKDVLGNDLQYIGKNPSRLRIVEGNCFKCSSIDHYNAGSDVNLEVSHFELSFHAEYNGVGQQLVFRNKNLFVQSGFFVQFTNGGQIELVLEKTGTSEAKVSTISGADIGKLTKYRIKKYGTSVQFFINGILTKADTFDSKYETLSYTETATTKFGAYEASLPYAGRLCDIILNELDITGQYLSRVAMWPLCEYIKTPSSHAAYDVSGNSNHATLVNGSTANRALRPYGDYSQKGLLDDGTKQVPILEDGSAFADGTALSDPNARLQDGFAFIKTSDVTGEGTKLEAYPVPRLEVNGRYLDASGVPKKIPFSDFNGAETGDKDLSDISEANKVKQIRSHEEALTGKQLDTEKRITNNL